MTYEETMRYINSRLRFGIRPGLERMQNLLSKLGNPQRKLRFVHVAGTNGKGSVSTMIASGLICSGLRTGLYTSPYISDFRERMQIDNQMIAKDELSQITCKVKELVGDDEQLTEFELITCIAFVWFAQRNCDVVVLEVGLGGRLDATNVIENPLCSVIMRIDYDHMAVLGDTIAEIAAEKAGIIKPGCPVVIFPDQPEEAMNVIIRKAKLLDNKIAVPDMCKVSSGALTLSGTDVTYDGLSYHLPLLGGHQVLNSVTAVEALRIVGADDEAIRKGIERASIPARLEVVSQSPAVIIDGAHNPNGAQALAGAISELMPDRRRIAVMGMLSDKDYSRELEIYGKTFDMVFTADGYSPRALSAAELCDAASVYTKAQACGSPEAAFDMALDRALKQGDAVIVCGSLYLAGRLRQYIIDRFKATPHNSRQKP